MPNRPKWTDDAPLRIAPNTVVTWYDGNRRRSGRVLHNIPGIGRKPGSVVVKADTGDRLVMGLRKVSILRAEGQGS
jgi:hypothetical protein